MNKLLIMLVSVLGMYYTSQARDFQIIASPAAALSIDNPALFGWSAQAGVKMGRHYIGGEYDEFPEGEAEKYDGVTNREVSGWGLFYLYDLFVSSGETFHIALGLGAGHWHEDLIKTYEDGTVETQVGDMNIAPKLQFGKDVSDLIQIFTSAEVPFWMRGDAPCLGIYIDLGVAFKF